jgi:hypothetical protein
LRNLCIYINGVCETQLETGDKFSISNLK